MGGIDLGGLGSKISNGAFSSTLLNGLLGGTLCTAFLITIMMILLIMIMYPAKRNTSTGVLFKMFLYMFLFNTAVLFLHDCIVSHCALQQKESSQNQEFMGGMTLNGRDPTYGAGASAAAARIVYGVNPSYSVDDGQYSDADGQQSQQQDQNFTSEFVGASEPEELSFPKPPVLGGNMYR